MYTGADRLLRSIDDTNFVSMFGDQIRNSRVAYNCEEINKWFYAAFLAVISIVHKAEVMRQILFFLSLSFSSFLSVCRSCTPIHLNVHARAQ